MKHEHDNELIPVLQSPSWSHVGSASLPGGPEVGTGERRDTYYQDAKNTIWAPLISSYEQKKMMIKNTFMAILSHPVERFLIKNVPKTRLINKKCTYALVSSSNLLNDLALIFLRCLRFSLSHSHEPGGPSFNNKCLGTGS